jgi:hypothetical protein
MLKSKDILVQKAKEVETLKAAIEENQNEIPKEDLHPKTVVNDEGKKILVFSDPLYSREKRSVVNYTIFRGKWEFENLDDIDEGDPDKCAVKFVPVRDSSNITIAFKSLKDRVEFMDSIYSDNEMKQTGTGANLEKIANSKVLRATGGLIGLSYAGYKLYKLIKKNNS